jgi:hypothetical protein
MRFSPWNAGALKRELILSACCGKALFSVIRAALRETKAPSCLFPPAVVTAFE